MLPKKGRIINRDLLDFIQTLPCMACGKEATEEKPNDPHHITTVKNFGDDTYNNVIPLCRAHHVEWHAIGPGKLSRKYPTILKWLRLTGRQDVLRRAKR